MLRSKVNIFVIISEILQKFVLKFISVYFAAYVGKLHDVSQCFIPRN